MSSVRDALLKEINDKIERKKKLREEVARRNDDVEVFVMNLMNEVDDMMSKTVNTDLWEALVPAYVNSLENRIKSLDRDARVEVSWHTSDTPGVPNRINGVLIKWSPAYQLKHSCEPERFIDPTSLLFS
jgi:hypothetical protein